MRDIKYYLSCFIFMLLFGQQQAWSQNRSVQIKFIDQQSKTSISGLTIRDVARDIQLTSDAEGRVELTLNEDPSRFLIRAIGYQANEFFWSLSNVPAVVPLESTEQELETIVITGYTKQAKIHTTGAVFTLPAREMGQMPVSSFDQSLQGQVPGLYVASPSGQPGTAGRISIRGIGSLQDENTSPLFILDGVPISAESFSSLNPQNFDQVSVLKDAAATAQYGSRGANGVLVISSKKGNAVAQGKSQINYNHQFGISTVNNSKWDMMNSAERLRFEEILQDPTLPGWAYSRNNPYKIHNQVQLPKTEQDYVYGDQRLQELAAQNTDWRKLLFRTGKTQMHDLSLSIHTENTSVFSSVGYFDQQGVLPQSGLKRMNFNTGVAHQRGAFSTQMHVNLAAVDVRLSESDFDVSETNPVAAAYFSLPYDSPYDAEGNLNTGVNRFGANALSMYQDMSRKQKQYKSVLSGNFAYQLSDNFKLTSTQGLDFQQIAERHIIRPDTYFGELVEPGERGSYEQMTSNYLSFISNIGMNFQKSWSAHFMEVIALAEMNRQQRDSYGFIGYGLIPGFDQYPAGISPGTADNNLIPQIQGAHTSNLLVSQIGLFRYSYANKYTLTASLRRDGSSRVPTENRFKYFYALGGSWNLKGEDFLAKLQPLSTARLRISHGLTGNAAGFASDFGYRRLYQAGQYNGQNSYLPFNPGNAEYNWEMNRMSDIGLELGFFQNRLLFELDLYHRLTSNLFVDRRLSATTGFESMPDNLGKIRNAGVELRLAGDLIRKNDFQLNLGLNLAYNKNRIVSLGNEEEIITEDYSIHRVGHALGHFYMVRWAGVNAETGAPQYRDIDGQITEVFNPEDAVLVKGSFDPPIKGGLTARVSYKNISLSTLFTFIHGMYRLNTGELYRTSADANYRIYNQSRSMLAIWQKPGDQSAHPGAQYPRYMTDRELQSADYIKLRNIHLNYKLGLKEQAAKYLKQVNFFVQGQNLMTWTKFKAQDPEDDNNWYQYEYPLPRTITAGVQLTF